LNFVLPEKKNGKIDVFLIEDAFSGQWR